MTTLQLVVHFFIELAVSMFVGYLVGRKLDLWLFPGKHAFTIVFIFLGLVAALVQVFRRIVRMTGGKDDENKKSEHD